MQAAQPRASIPVEDVVAMVFGAKTFAKKGFLIENKLMEWRCFSLVTDHRSWDFVVQDDRAARSFFVVVQVLRTGAAGGQARVGALLWHVARMRLHRHALVSGLGLCCSLAAVVRAAAADMHRRTPHQPVEPGDEGAGASEQLTESETMLVDRGLRASDVRLLTSGVDAVLMATDAADTPVQSSSGTVCLRFGEAGSGAARIDFDTNQLLAHQLAALDAGSVSTVADLPEGTPPRTAHDKSVGADSVESDNATHPQLTDSLARTVSAARSATHRKKKRGGMFCCSARSRDETPPPSRASPGATASSRVADEIDGTMGAAEEAQLDSATELASESDEDLLLAPARCSVDSEQPSDESELDAITPLNVDRSLGDRPHVLQAVHHFTPVRKTDLALSIGDLVVVTNSDPSKTWWTGHLQQDPDRSGDFPFNYVEDIDAIVEAQLELEVMHVEMLEHANRRGSNLARRIQYKLLASCFYAWSSSAPSTNLGPSDSACDWPHQPETDGDSEQALQALVQSLGAASPASRAAYQQLLHTIKRRTREQEKSHRLKLLLPYLTGRQTSRLVGEAFEAWLMLAHEHRCHSAVLHKCEKRRMWKIYVAWRTATVMVNDRSRGASTQLSAEVRPQSSPTSTQIRRNCLSLSNINACQLCAHRVDSAQSCENG
eukprot:COSAG06_NODE_3577_length_5163_cov_2.736374_1_plen_660_part_10